MQSNHKTNADSDRATAEYSFLLESATGSSETIGRYSYIGASKPIMHSTVSFKLSH